MEKIRVRIGKDGKVNLDTEGFKGGKCKDVTEALKKALGNVKTEELKMEYYEEVEQEHNDATLGA